MRNKKFCSLSLASLMLVSSIFSFPTNAYASTTARISGSEVSFRSKPTTDKENGVSNVIKYLSLSSSVTVNSLDKVSGNGCNEGWYSINYQGTNGYVCSRYVSFEMSDIYDRPWNSPKKAIVGGAKFISQGYINQGQFTSYLKKFNVNPNSHYDMYNHQYMANLAAPSSEALTSFKAYSSNGLLDSPLVFSIPVYTEMDEKYDRPTGNLISIEVQSEVTDQSFEDYLNNEGFPESYKKALRVLHKNHPNWTFKAMNSGSFKTAVLNEKLVSSIQGNNAFYEVTNGGYTSTEYGWYLANDATVSYYLDPRNFLTEKYILQFENLEYSDTHTESVIKSILANTFMSDYSLLDNQTYASIFVEAGKTANVSSIYLASLAIQESGRNGGNNTSGAEFDYEGTTYKGLFNFFNIGANSSASNPSKAGLVYASGGVCTNCGMDNEDNFNIPINNTTTDNNTTSSTPSTPNIALKNYIANAGFKISSSFISGFYENQKVSEVKDKLQNNNISVKSSKDVITTGSVISYGSDTYTVVILGDLTGDGVINSADLLKMRQHLIGTSKLDGANFKAGALIDGSTISSKDLLRLRQHLLGNAIEQ